MRVRHDIEWKYRAFLYRGDAEERRGKNNYGKENKKENEKGLFSANLR